MQSKRPFASFVIQAVGQSVIFEGLIFCGGCQWRFKCSCWLFFF